MCDAVVGQLRSEPRLQRRLGQPWTRVIVWERPARGGGGTNWFVAETASALQAVFDRLRPGSMVYFWFAGQIRVAARTSQLEADLYALLRQAGEILVGARSADGPAVTMEAVSGPGELDDALAEFAGATELVYGPWPGVDDDGVASIRLTLVDADGVQRHHPH